jgi:hypothetical protein
LRGWQTRTATRSSWLRSASDGHAQQGLEAEGLLDEIIAERSERNPEFPGLVEAARRRRRRESAVHSSKAAISRPLI